MKKKEMDLLLEALQGLENSFWMEEEREESKYWREITVPYQLKDILGTLTKGELTHIRQRLNLKNLSKLKKEELAEELAKQLPANAGMVFLLLDEERYSFAQRIEQNGGFVYVNDLELYQVEFLREQGVFFPGLLKGKKVLTMASELIEAFRRLNGQELKRQVKRNTELIRLTHGLLYYYGVLNFEQLGEMLTKHTGEALDYYAYIELMADAEDYYQQIDRWYLDLDEGLESGFADWRVLVAEELLHEQRARAGIDYYPFTKKQLLTAGDPDYIEETPAFQSLVRFFKDHYEIPEIEAKELAVECQELVNEADSPLDIINFLRNEIEFPSFDIVQELTEHLNTLWNTTRQWILKGHTAEEIRTQEKKSLQLFPKVPFAQRQPLPLPHLLPLQALPQSAAQTVQGEVIDFKTRTKVGRNDPCPCGSGKKFKHCCGR